MKRTSIYYSLILLALASCGKKVEKIKPSVAAITESIYASGIIKSQHQYEAYAAINGIVETVFADEGDKLRKGDPILSVSNETQTLNRENAQLAATFADVKANEGKLNEASLLIELAGNKMKNDSVLLVRQQNLWRQEIGSKTELEQRDLAYQNSKAAYFSAVVRYNDLKRQLNYTSQQAKKNLQISSRMESEFILRSDIDGVLYSLNKTKGEIVTAQTPLAVIGDSEKFVLEMQVDEYDILRIRKGLTVLVTLDSYKDKVFEAQVTKINPLMNERTKTFLVEATFLQQPEILYPNISFEANIVIQTKSNALLVPRNYILNDSLVVKPNGEKIAVKTGLKDYQQIEILSGIGPDQELIKPTE